MNAIQLANLQLALEPHFDNLEAAMSSEDRVQTAQANKHMQGLTELQTIYSQLQSLYSTVNAFSGRPIRAGTAKLIQEERDGILGELTATLGLEETAPVATKDEAKSFVSRAMDRVKKLIDKVLKAVQAGLARLFNTNVRAAHVLRKEAKAIESRINAMAGSMIIPAELVYEAGTNEVRSLITDQRGDFNRPHLEGYVKWYGNLPSTAEMAKEVGELADAFGEVNADDAANAAASIAIRLSVYDAAILSKFDMGIYQPVGKTKVATWDRFAPGGGTYSAMKAEGSNVSLLQRKRGNGKHNDIKALDEVSAVEVARLVDTMAGMVVDAHREVVLIDRTITKLASAAKSMVDALGDQPASQSFADAAIRIADNLRARVRIETEFLQITRELGMLTARSVKGAVSK